MLITFLTWDAPKRGVKYKTFKNTFAPLIDHEILDVEQIILGMRLGVVEQDKLPPAAKKAIKDEIDKRTKALVTPMRLLILLLGSVGDVKYKTRLQKYAFLADNQLLQAKEIKTNKLVCHWKPHHYGPFSYNLEICVNEAIEEKLVASFQIHEDGKTPGVGYRLTIKGRAEFKRLLPNFHKASKLIRGMLIDFQKDSTEYKLLEFVYQMHPKYTEKSVIRGRFANADRN